MSVLVPPLGSVELRKAESERLDCGGGGCLRCFAEVLLYDSREVECRWSGAGRGGATGGDGDEGRMGRIVVVLSLLTCEGGFTLADNGSAFSWALSSSEDGAVATLFTL